RFFEAQDEFDAIIDQLNQDKDQDVLDLARQIEQAQTIGNNTASFLNDELTDARERLDERTADLTDQILKAKKDGDAAALNLANQLNQAYRTGNDTETNLNEELETTRERFFEAQDEFDAIIDQLNQDKDQDVLDLARQIEQAQTIGNNTASFLNDELTDARERLDERTADLTDQILQAQKDGDAAALNLANQLNQAYRTGNDTETNLNEELENTRERFFEAQDEFDAIIDQLNQDKDQDVLDLARQ